MSVVGLEGALTRGERAGRQHFPRPTGLTYHTSSESLYLLHWLTQCDLANLLYLACSAQQGPPLLIKGRRKLCPQWIPAIPQWVTSHRHAEASCGMTHYLHTGSKMGSAHIWLKATTTQRQHRTRLWQHRVLRFWALENAYFIKPLLSRPGGTQPFYLMQMNKHRDSDNMRRHRSMFQYRTPGKGLRKWG